LLETDDGCHGIGEGWSRQTEVAAQLEALSRRYAPLACGADIADAASIARLGARLRAVAGAGEPSWIAAGAVSAIDIAAWDLLARSRGEPLWKTLGGASPEVRVYASGGLYRDGATIADLAAEMRGYRALGFDAFKMKIGAQPFARDLERVGAVRAAIGTSGTLWVDAVNQLDRGSALHWTRAMSDAGAAAIQAPVPFDDLETMAAINRDILPVAAGEAAHEPAQFAVLLEAGAVTWLQPSLGLCGGISGGGIVAALARARGTGVSPQTFGTAILQAAALHFGAATAGVGGVEYHRFHDHLAALLPASARAIREGTVRLGVDPGLGIAPPSTGAQADGGTLRLHHRLTHDSLPEHVHG
jgi:L-alanine-DL-glutamate epimerase-like enolase superfamily enzyme